MRDRRYPQPSAPLIEAIEAIEANKKWRSTEHGRRNMRLKRLVAPFVSAVGMRRRNGLAQWRLRFVWAIVVDSH